VIAVISDGGIKGGRAVESARAMLEIRKHHDDAGAEGKLSELPMIGSQSYRAILSMLPDLLYVAIDRHGTHDSYQAPGVKSWPAAG
jgi:hypothetical protein